MSNSAATCGWPGCVTKAQHGLSCIVDGEGLAACAVHSFKNSPEAVNHPPHYGGKDDPYETIKIWEALGWLEPTCLATAMKYIMRAGKKDPSKKIEDLKKARFYLNYLINDLEDQE